MTEIHQIESRIRAIEARVANLASLGSSNSPAGAPLGFGLALEAAKAEAPATIDPNSGSTASSHSSSTTLPGTALPGAPGTTLPGTSLPFPVSTTLPISTTPLAAPTISPATPIAGTSQTTGLTPATKLPGSYGRLEPPAALVPYGNGRVPTTALEPVGNTGHRLYEPAAQALTTLINDAKADGVTVGITDSYRPLAVQERLAKEKGLYSKGGLAATPGTSNHGWGVATDLKLDNDALIWMRKNAWRYGFVEDVPREPWHWTYRPDEK